MSLTIENLNKSYGALHILKDINITSPEGEFLVLVGSSGCGKSTLLNSIGGLDSIDSGKIFNQQKEITHLSPKARDIAMVFQSYALYPTMSVRDNIAFGLKMQKLPPATIAAKINEVANILQIQELLDRKPSQLSGGQKQRVAMGRAIARAPALYLFDEPLSNLDAKLRVDMRLEIKKLHQKVKKNIVYVTHDQIEAMTLADRIAIMKAGEIVQIGTPDEVYFQPKNIFVAKFIGSNPINLLHAQVITHPADANQLAVQITPSDNNGGTEGEPVTLPVPSHLQAYHHKEIILGIRPEHISNTAGEDKVAIPSHIALEEKTGADTFLFTTWNGAEVKARCIPQPTTPTSLPLYFSPNQALYFNPTPTDQPLIATCALI